MKKTWLGGGIAALLLAGPAFAQDYSKSCEKFKADIAKQKATCPDEDAAAAKLACKTKEDMNAALKLFQACGNKAVAAATAGKSGGAAAGAAAASASKDRHYQDLDATDNKDIAEA